ncbi:MAG TPA: hypothetical protein VK348_00410 [Planctomycetota bacterium]|nr:hypothetical protein [Planctomycetota bacterium]
MPDRSRSDLLLVATLFTACSEPTALAPTAPPELAITRPVAAPPAPDYQAHALALRAMLPHAGFALAIEPPFVVVAEGGEAVARRWATGTVRWAVQHLKAQYFERDPATILDIWLFDGDASYRRYSKQVFGDEPDTPYGYYSSRHGALIMNIATGGGTLVHEIVHPFVAANFPGCPAWLNEGLGSLYEQSAERDGRIVGLTNWRLDGLQAAIRERRTMAIAELLATSDAEFYGAGSGLHYAEARYLLYWLQEHGQLQRFWQAFGSTRTTDPTGLLALQQSLGTDDLAAFQAQWEQWLLTLQRE